MNSPNARRFLALITAFAFATAIPFGASSGVAGATGTGTGAGSRVPTFIGQHTRYRLLPVSKAEAARLARDANQRVMIILRSQFKGMSARGQSGIHRHAEIAGTQQPLLHELRIVHARRITSFHLINAIAATVSKGEEAYLSRNPEVAKVVPDAVIQPPQLPKLDVGAVRKMLHRNAAISKACRSWQLQPEALGLTHTAYKDRKTPQAQNYVDGAGVKVAFIADALDPFNPDLIRPDGTPVITDYED
ncbi:MAG TPA: hypothetical protein VFB34_09010, partial [Chloroflexota bacterium]|nr:hypothetical protein [Chloroflexota bacterium]